MSELAGLAKGINSAITSFFGGEIEHQRSRQLKAEDRAADLENDVTKLYVAKSLEAAMKEKDAAVPLANVLKQKPKLAPLFKDIDPNTPIYIKDFPELSRFLESDKVGGRGPDQFFTIEEAEAHMKLMGVSDDQIKKRLKGFRDKGVNEVRISLLDNEKGRNPFLNSSLRAVSNFMDPSEPEFAPTAIKLAKTLDQASGTVSLDPANPNDMAEIDKAAQVIDQQLANVPKEQYASKVLELSQMLGEQFDKDTVKAIIDRSEELDDQAQGVQTPKTEPTLRERLRKALKRG
jgi:hypothetical protein